jgi:hypothetical protein
MSAVSILLSSIKKISRAFINGKLFLDCWKKVRLLLQYLFQSLFHSQ